MNTKPVTVGADVTVDVWFVCRVYICTKARHIPLHPLKPFQASAFTRDSEEEEKYFWDSVQENFTWTK